MKPKNLNSIGTCYVLSVRDITEFKYLSTSGQYTTKPHGEETKFFLTIDEAEEYRSETLPMLRNAENKNIPAIVKIDYFYNCEEVRPGLRRHVA